MLNPSTVTRRLNKAFLAIGRRLLVWTCKAIWYGPYGDRDRAGNSLADSMRTMAGAIANIFRRL